MLLSSVQQSEINTYTHIYTNTWASQVALVVKNLPANAGDVTDVGLIPGLGRSPAGGHGNPLQCSCLENPMDRGAWWAAVHRIAKSVTQLKQLSTHARMHIHTHKYTYTYTFKYQLPSKLDEVVRGTNIRGVTPLCLALCKALDRQRWIKQGLVYPEHSIWQRRRGRHRIRWNNNVITDLPVKGQRCQGPKSRKWVMLGKGEARCPGFRRG